eukprot:3384260-Lingulodinium_polyedra.AAC.1
MGIRRARSGWVSAGAGRRAARLRSVGPRVPLRALQGGGGSCRWPAFARTSARGGRPAPGGGGGR